MEIWKTLLACIQKRISDQNFEIWFSPTSLERHDQVGRKLHVRVPNGHFQYWLTENYSDVIRASLEEVNLPDYQVMFLCDVSDSTEKSNGEASIKPCDEPFLCSLNLKYTFSRFVVGDCNQFAHAASLAVAEQPSKAYNPLFIYGGVGLGKTHLMHAIGHYIKERNPHTRLAYLSSERFMNELINSIRYEKMLQFREKYRNTDVLLMDDVQFLAGKERTQEEFFHTFNALYDAQKQIVISSDSAPREIPTLEERLHSRFEWGLIADIQPPDLETKVAILRKKAEMENVVLPDDVAFFIARNIKSNIRELEGSLVRLFAYSSLTGQEINIGLAHRVLRNIAENNAKPVTIDQIQKAVAEIYGIKVSELRSKNNARRVSEPRQVAMYLARKLTKSSLPDIGREFSGKHHTTVLHAIRKVGEACSTDPRINSIINKVTTSLR
jgi:chromosomal replication initiator protein